MFFGSEARGQAGPWSDIDVAIISPDFADDLFAAQLTLMKLAAATDERIEPRAFFARKLLIPTIRSPVRFQDNGVRVA
jgi:predicted nucleotidyltransferase